MQMTYQVQQVTDFPLNRTYMNKMVNIDSSQCARRVGYIICIIPKLQEQKNYKTDYNPI